MKISAIPCWKCHAFHGVECPRLRPLKKAELLALALEIEAGWRANRQKIEERENRIMRPIKALLGAAQ